MAQRRQIRVSRSLEGEGERPATGYGEPEAGAFNAPNVRRDGTGQPLAGLGSLSVTSETLAPCASFVVEGLDLDAGRREAVEKHAAVVLREHPWI